MWQRMRRLGALGVLTVAAIAAAAPNAGASVAATLSLDQSAGTAAGSFANLGVDLKFSSSSGDSPRRLTLNLPPGLLADASIDGGACLGTADLNDSACQVGSGVVTANLLGTIPVPTQVTFDLVPPPAAGDLAGLAVNSNGTQIGSTGEIRVRPSGDPAGVGVTIDLTLPNSLFGTPMSIAEIDSTFDGLRYPTTCPATPQSFTAAVDSYGDATVHALSTPLSVTGCSALAYAPVFGVTAARDRTDSQVSLATTVTQRATEAPSKSVSLVFPRPTVNPNIQAVAALCADLSTGNCAPVGSVSASSPLYPTPLTGQAYLTGSIAAQALTLVFPAPFPLTLTGTVDLARNSTTFTGLPDIPLTNLTVSLNAGPHAVFGTLCRPPSGTATATLTDQNGDRTVTAPAKLTIAGCGSGRQRAAGKPKVTGASIAGLRSGHPSLAFTIRAPTGTARLRGLTLVLPRGLSLVAHRAAVHVTGGGGVALSFSHGRLMIRLRTAAQRLTVTIGSRALQESSALRAQAQAHHLRRLVLSVITSNTAGKPARLRVRFTHPGR